MTASAVILSHLFLLQKLLHLHEKLPVSSSSSSSRIDLILIECPISKSQPTRQLLFSASHVTK